MFEVEENASDVSDEADIRPRQSRADCVSQVPVAARRVREFLREEYTLAFRHEHWHVGIVDAPIHSFLEPDSRPDVHWFPLPDRGKYLADPFGLPRGDRLEVLFEEFDLGTRKGVISAASWDAKGGVSGPRVVLDLPFHASYPFLVERRGTVFCIPETSQGREVALYRAVEFPHRWTKEATLIRGVAAVDNTVFEHEGRFWLMHTDAEDGLFTKLRIWHAPDLLGPWQPHEANPVKTDIRSSAPAGTPFRFDGDLYRPAQDCSETYGGSVVLNRIVRLTTKEFREEQVAIVSPFRDGPRRQGIHTLSSVGDRTLVDGKRFSFSGRAMGRNFRDAIGGRWNKVLVR